MIRDGAELRVVEAGGGRPIVFQHGLGGDSAQVADHIPDDLAWRFLTLECRAQGESQPGESRPFSIAMFAADVLAMADARGLDRFVLGGISMGAAISLRIAALHPDRVSALILARPAWLFDSAPDNMRPFAEVADLLAAHAPAEARALFAASDTAAMLTRDAPDNLASLMKFFDRPDPAVTADLLGGISRDGPGVTAEQAAAIAVPTLVIGHEIDVVHPLATAQALAAAIPSARFVQVAPKATERARHRSEFQAALRGFLHERSA